MMEEWFRQGDREQSMGLEVSPMMDRRKPNIPRGQVGFIDYIVRPLFVNWNKLFAVTRVCIDNLGANRQRWNELNADPNANNVQFHVDKYRTSTVIDLNEPIKYSPEHKESAPENNKVATESVAAEEDESGSVVEENAEQNMEMNVPFTPKQALALHVSYSDQMGSDAEDMALDFDEDNGRRRIDTLMD